MKATFILTLVAASSAIAHASFELVLVTDSITRSVHRFDGNSGAYLGSFGQNHFELPDGIAINPALGHAYIADQSLRTVSVFNCSTGEFIREWMPSVGALNVNLTSTGDVLVAGSDGAARYTATGQLLNSYSSLSTYGIVQGSDGAVYASDSGGRLRRYPLGGGSPTFTSGANFAITWQMSARGGQALLANYADNAVDSLATGTSPTVTRLFSTASRVQVLGVAFGHDSRVFAVGIDATSPSRGTVGVYSQLTNTWRGSFGESVLINPRSVAVVVAPEPASLAALGIGLALVGRRRRRRS